MSTESGNLPGGGAMDPTDFMEVATARPATALPAAAPPATGAPLPASPAAAVVEAPLQRPKPRGGRRACAWKAPIVTGPFKHPQTRGTNQNPTDHQPAPTGEAKGDHRQSASPPGGPTTRACAGPLSSSIEQIDREPPSGPPRRCRAAFRPRPPRILRAAASTKSPAPLCTAPRMLPSSCCPSRRPRAASPPSRLPWNGAPIPCHHLGHEGASCARHAHTQWGA